MKKLYWIGAALVLAAGGLGVGAAAEGDVLHVRTAMKDQVNPAIFGVWDITNNAMGDDGGIDPKLMDDAKWATVETHARALAAASHAMAHATTLTAAAPDDQAIDEGAVSMAVIQQHIDANPAAFRAFAAAQAEHAEKLAAAAKAHDAATAGELVSGMDAVCEACHSKYWYPEQ